MLTYFRKRIKERTGKTVDNETLLRVLGMAKSDRLMNNLILGKDVMATEFENVAVECLKVIEREAEW